jgi:hypothetical protein
MNLDHVAYADWDAAYVLGALASADRRAFEAHLQDCERCRVAVAELAAMPGLLARARPVVEPIDDLAPPDGPSPDLVDLVTGRRAQQRHRFRRRLVLGITSMAAALAIAVGVPILVMLPPAAAATITLAPIAESTMTATAGLRPVAWGTDIQIECVYPAGGTWGDETGPWTYVLIVTDEAGHSSQVSTWSAVPGNTVSLDAATAIPFDQVASLEVRKADGETILAALVDR